MTTSLCSTGYSYDAEDAQNLAFAISTAKRELGAALQARGELTQIVYPESWRGMNPDYAGELAAAVINLSQRQLACWRPEHVMEWVHDYLSIARWSGIAVAS